MKTIKYRESYSSAMFHKLLPRAWKVLIFLMLALIILTSAMFIPAMKQYLWGIAITVVIVFVLVRKHSDSLFENIGNFKKGKRGEDEVAAMLKENLDDNYTCVENYMIPNARIGDIDGLLIGPKGVVILEVKNYQGVFRISGPDLYRRNRGDKIILCIKKVLSFKQLGRKIIFLNILKIRALAMYL